MRTIISKSLEAKFNEGDEEVLMTYYSLIFGDDFADALIHDPSQKPSSGKKKKPKHKKRKKKELDDEGFGA